MNKLRKPLLLVIIVFSMFDLAFAQSNQIDISQSEWNIWLDKDAEWINDELFVPPVNLSKLPLNEPTGGWTELKKQKSKSVTLPATVEEYFWGESGNEHGISGNYVGVSWFYTNFKIPSSWKEKNIFLDFESVRLRAEIFINNELVGYDLINGTPFSVDISKYAKIGQDNFLAVRITDPCGNFAWRDWDAFNWGDQLIPPSHGFGGITGKVFLRSTPDTYIDDVYVKNRPDFKTVDIEFTISNLGEESVKGSLEYSIFPINTDKEVFKKKILLDKVSDKLKVEETITLPNALLWSIDQPNLYVIQVKWTGNNGDEYSFQRRFGFRYFEVKEINGDKMFFLNGKRIVLRTAISWGHWPINGIYPTTELARKQIETAKAFGLNMLNFHRGIGQTQIFDLADEMGLLYYEEPGGYKPNDTELLKAWKREKLLRMAKRDRNHPSLVIYNLINESNREPFANELVDMADLHKIDKNRIVTFTTTYFGPKFYNGKCPLTPAPFKSHMLPNDTTIYSYGWWDEHHAGGPGVYLDEFYDGPEKIYRHYNNPSEIIFLGEEGAIGTLPRLQLIKNEIDKTNKKGWDGDAYIKQYEAIDNYLKEYGFNNVYPTVDEFTKDIGKVSYYYQGRTIENFRIGNTGDGYAVNGWEDEKIENHSGIVDVFRNPKADVKLLAQYNQPLYVAVKVRDKVIQLGEKSICDLYIINEQNLKGKFDLQITASDSSGEILNRVIPVTITGGNVYGELLVEGLEISPTKAAYTMIKARLTKGKRLIAEGEDEIYAVEYSPEEMTEKFAVVDTSEMIQKMLKEAHLTNFTSYKSKTVPTEKVLLVGATIQPGFIKGSFRQDDPILDWVAAGNTLIITSGADEWAQYLEQKEVIEYRGKREIGTNWFGGNYFVREHPFFKGLPVNTAFNWEYQSLASYNRDRIGLRIPAIESVVGVYADHKQEVYTAVAVIPLGQGRIILSTLDLQKAIASDVKSSVVAKRILMNYLTLE